MYQMWGRVRLSKIHTTCSGTGTVHRTRTITVRIPAGVIDGQKVRLAGQGEAGPNGTPAGDLSVHVIVRPDRVFDRDGDDLRHRPALHAELAPWWYCYRADFR